MWEVPQTQTWEQMKVDDLMRMSSGLDWREKYEDSPTDSDVINTLYGSGSDDIIKYIFKRPLKYYSGRTILLLDGRYGAFNSRLKYGPWRGRSRLRFCP